LITRSQQAEYNKGKYLIIVVPEDNIVDNEEFMAKSFQEVKILFKQMRQENISR
jgi:hypothetical protein